MNTETIRIRVREVEDKLRQSDRETGGAMPAVSRPERFAYSNYKSFRNGRGSLLTIRHHDGSSRTHNENIFYGKFRCSVVLPTD